MDEFLLALSAYLLILWTAGIVRVVWSSNKRGERLFYTYCSLWLMGPVPFGFLWLDAAGLNALLVETGSAGAAIFSGSIVLAVISAFVGEALGF